MSKVTSGIVLFSLLMALSLGVAFANEEAAADEVAENATENATINATENESINATNETLEDVPVVESEAQSS